MELEGYFLNFWFDWRLRFIKSRLPWIEDLNWGPRGWSEDSLKKRHWISSWFKICSIYKVFQKYHSSFHKDLREFAKKIVWTFHGILKYGNKIQFLFKFAFKSYKVDSCGFSQCTSLCKVWDSSSNVIRHDFPNSSDSKSQSFIKNYPCMINSIQNSIRSPSKFTMIHYTKSSYFTTKLQESYKRNIKIPKVFFLIFTISTIWSVYLHLKLPLYHYRNLFETTTLLQSIGISSHECREYVVLQTQEKKSE